MKNMIVLVSALTMVVSSAALADGFVCKTTNDTLTVKIYDNTSAQEGTRTAAIMVVSDSSVRGGNQTVARFTEVDGTVSSSSEIYTAKVDLENPNSAKAGRLIGGTKLGQLDTIELAVDFQYDAPVAKGAEVDGILHLNKLNGATIDLDLECSRYLKN